MEMQSTATAGVGAAFAVWPPPLVEAVDPYDFGVATGAKRASGRKLNPYVPRDVDSAIVTALLQKSAVVIAAPPGAGAARTAYEVLNEAMPQASLVIPRRKATFDATELRGIGVSGEVVLWIDDLAAHWGRRGATLFDDLQEWLTHGQRWLIATCYDDHDVDLLNHPDFTRNAFPVIALPARLSPAELAAEKTIYGTTSTTTLIGRNPPRGPAATDLITDFSRSVNRVVAYHGIETPVTASTIAADLRSQYPSYAGNQLGTAEIDPRHGMARPLDEWLTMVRGCYDQSAVRASNHRVIDGRLCIRALVALDATLAGQISQPVLALLDGECEVHPKPPEPPEREHVRLLTDNPVGLDGDELGRRGVAGALTQQLRTLVDQQPGRSFLVHIDGAWGAGKSTLLGFVRDEIAQRVAPTPSTGARRAGSPDPSWLVVPYDAWRQSKAGQPWLTLMHAVRGAVSAIQPRVWGKSWFWVRERARLINRWQWFALLLMAGAVAGVAWLVTGHTEMTVGAWGDWAKIVGGLLPVVAAGWLIASAAGRFVLLDSRRSARAFFEDRVDPMEDLAGHFDWLLRQARRPVMLLVDDLDRCPETFVVDLLDAIQKLMRDTDAHHPKARRGGKPPSLVVIVAADGRWVRQSFDNAYAGLAKAVDVPGATVGSLYLEKMFQLTVPVPRLSDELKVAYLRDLLAEPTTPPAAGGADPDLLRRLNAAPHEELLGLLAAVPEVERIKVAETAIQRLVVAPGAGAATRHALEPFATLLDTTPRAMKRFVMAYSMLRAVRTAEGSVVGLGPLALWTILMTRWPTLADYLQHSPEMVRLFSQPAERIPSTTPADLVPLFTDPPYELRQIMNHVAGPLNEAKIRQCSGQGNRGAERPTHTDEFEEAP